MEVIFRGSRCCDNAVVLKRRACRRYRDAESVKNWILKEIYAVEITAKHRGEIERMFAGERGLRKVFNKDLFECGELFPLIFRDSSQTANSLERFASQRRN